MAKKRNGDPEDKVTEMMFKRAKELGYDVDNPSVENYEKVTKELKKRKNLPDEIAKRKAAKK